MFVFCGCGFVLDICLCGFGCCNCSVDVVCCVVCDGVNFSVS